MLLTLLIDVVLQGLIDIRGRSFLPALDDLAQDTLGVVPTKPLSFASAFTHLMMRLFATPRTRAAPWFPNELPSAQRILVNAAAFSLNAMV